jgi:hypothetical protein
MSQWNRLFYIRFVKVSGRPPRYLPLKFGPVEICKDGNTLKNMWWFISTLKFIQLHSSFTAANKTTNRMRTKPNFVMHRYYLLIIVKQIYLPGLVAGCFHHHLIIISDFFTRLEGFIFVIYNYIFLSICVVLQHWYATVCKTKLMKLKLRTAVYFCTENLSTRGGTMALDVEKYRRLILNRKVSDIKKTSRQRNIFLVLMKCFFRYLRRK